MDPCSSFGIATGAVQTVHVLGCTIQSLRSLYDKYISADQIINSMIQEVQTVTAALSDLSDWASSDPNDSLKQPDYLQAMRIAVIGCRETADVLLEEIASIVQNFPPDAPPLDITLGFRARLKMIWNGSTLDEHRRRLDAQLRALQFLLQVSQCRTATEQLDLLRREENRRLIKTVADDTTTLRSTRSAASSVVEPSIRSIRSGRSSSFGGTVFDFDDRVVNSGPYRLAMAHRMRVFQTDENVAGGQNQMARHPSQATSRTLDEGYASADPTIRTANPFRSPEIPRSTLSDAGQSAATSPVDQLSPLQIPNPNPKDDISRSKTTSLGRSSSRAYLNVIRSKSDAPALKKSPSKRELFNTALSRMKSSRQPNGRSLSVSSAAADARPLRKPSKCESNISINVSSPSGIMAPPIVKAAQAGALPQVEVHIRSGVDIESRHEETSRTALAVAAHCGKGEIIDLLLAHNAKANTQDFRLQTPLHLAAERGYTSILDRLLREDVEINARDSAGRTPFWIAAENRHTSAVKVLLDAGSRINSRAGDEMTALHKAASVGDIEMVSLLLHHSIDLEAKDAHLKTALHHACERGHTVVVEKLLLSGAKAEALGEHRMTPLICAAVMGRLLTVTLLLKKGALINATDENGLSALHWAAFNGHAEIVGLLVKKKASVTATTKLGRTPLHLAVRGRQFATVELLVRGKPPLEIRCAQGLTALHYACSADAGNPDLVRLLLDAGANIEAEVTGSLRRAIHLAIVFKSLEICRLLQTKGADINCVDGEGFTPLCLACRTGQLDVIRWLLNLGVSPRSHHTDHYYGVSPICLAAAGGSWPIVSLLIEAGASASECDGHGWNSLIYAAHYGHFPILEYLLKHSDLTAKQSLVTLFFQIGFAAVYIDPEWKEKVRDVVVQLSNDLARGQVQGGLPGVGPPISPYRPSFANHMTHVSPPPIRAPAMPFVPYAPVTELPNTDRQLSPVHIPSTERPTRHIAEYNDPSVQRPANQPSSPAEPRPAPMTKPKPRLPETPSTTQPLTQAYIPASHPPGISPSISPDLPDMASNIGLDFRIGDFPSFTPFESRPISVIPNHRLLPLSEPVQDHRDDNPSPSPTIPNNHHSNVNVSEPTIPANGNAWGRRSIQPSCPHEVKVDDEGGGDAENDDMSDADSIATFNTAPEVMTVEEIQLGIKLYELE